MARPSPDSDADVTPDWWENQNGMVNTAALLDTDGDGISNVFEYAFDLNPTAADSSMAAAVPTGIRADGLFALAFRKRVGAADLEYRVEVSTDLVGWADATDSVGWSTEEAGVTTVTTAAPVDSGSGVSVGFLRLRVIRH